MISYLGAKWNNRGARRFADSKKKKNKKITARLQPVVSLASSKHFNTHLSYTLVE